MKYFLWLVVILFAGCGSGEFQLAPVSGIVTMDGVPVEGVEVVFAPMESKGKIEVGPASTGKTDAEGKYTLNTVKGQVGAVVTNHIVSIGYPEVNEAEIAAKVDEAYQKNVNMPEQEILALENQIRRSMMNKKSIPAKYNKKTSLKFSVDGSTDSANFELTSDES